MAYGVAFSFVCFQLLVYLVNFHELYISVVWDQIISDAIWCVFYVSRLVSSNTVIGFEVLCCYDVQ
jgi:hypothetical protein